jgi:hypothetical protein
MYWPDFCEYKRTLADTSSFMPDRDNTLFPDHGAATRISDQDGFEVTYDQLLKELGRTAGAKVLFISRYFSIAGAPNDILRELNELTQPCEFFVLEPTWPQT